MKENMKRKRSIRSSIKDCREEHLGPRRYVKWFIFIQGRITFIRAFNDYYVVA